ncbi:MAG: HTH-type transcriptional activator IlvY [Deltaproteobacteria bacterium]|nr:HTH-type transcriptional activator IlvY [Deltaproteobacteria bacterium]
MDSMDLQSFMAVATTLHFGKAARLVHLSPSALTRSIQRLEQELNHELFFRDRRHVSLTPAGNRFLSFAQRTLDEWAQCRAILDAGEDELSGKLSIYSSVTAAHTILQDVLRPFRNQYPKVHVHLLTGTVADAILRIQDKTADCAVAAMPQKLPAGVGIIPLTTTSLECIAPIGFDNIPVYQANGAVDFAQTPLIMPDKDVSRNQQTHWFKSKHIRPVVYAEVAGNEAIIAMVSLGFGIGFVPGIVLNQSPLKNRIQVINVSPPLNPYAIGVVFREKRRNDPVIMAFCNVARNCFTS